jgi:hypothetical protein
MFVRDHLRFFLDILEHRFQGTTRLSRGRATFGAGQEHIQDQLEKHCFFSEGALYSKIIKFSHNVSSFIPCHHYIKDMIVAGENLAREQLEKSNAKRKHIWPNRYVLWPDCLFRAHIFHSAKPLLMRSRKSPGRKSGAEIAPFCHAKMPILTMDGILFAAIEDRNTFAGFTSRWTIL